MRLNPLRLQRSFWLDELFSAFAIIDEKFWSNLAHQNFNSSLPPALAVALRLVCKINDSDLALRLIPILSGLFSLPLFHLLTHRCSSNKKSGILALLLFSFCPAAIYFTSELKQYSTDILITVSLLLIATSKRSIHLGWVGAIAIWFSHPSIFVLGALYVTRLIKNKENRILFPIFWGTSFIILYFFSIKALSTHPQLILYWKVGNGFPTASPGAFLNWMRLLGSCLYNLLMISPWATFLLSSLGMIAYWKKKMKWLPLLFITILIEITLASALEKYPITDRLLLFLIPLLCLYVAEGIGFVWESKPTLAPFISILLGPILFWPLLKETLHPDRFPLQKEEMKEVMRFVQNHRKEGEEVYLYRIAHFAFGYYKSKIPFLGSFKMMNEEIKPKEKHFWILFSHPNWNEDVKLLYKLRSTTKILNQLKAGESSAYLFESL